ncbi:MAG: putative ABC transporter permease [Patescibacteria group bacterium]
MSVFEALVAFLLYSFVGWMIDTSVRSIDAKKFKSGNFLPIPLCPVYGIGALFALSLHHYLAGMPIILEGFLFGLLLASLELITGLFFLKFFHRRLWHYDGGILNIARFTDIFHVLAWGSLSLLVIYVIQPAIERVLDLIA